MEFSKRFQGGSEFTFLLNHTDETIRVVLPEGQRSALIGAVDISGAVTLDPFCVAILKSDC